MKKYTLVLIILFSVFIFSEFEKVESANVFHNIEVPKFQCGRYGPCSQTWAGSYLYYKSSLTAKFNKVINFVKQDGSNVGFNFELGQGETIDLVENPTTGRWFSHALSSWSYRNINDPFNSNLGQKTVWHEREVLREDWDANQMVKMYGNTPVDGAEVTIISSDPSVIECVDLRCTGKSLGNASISVSFGSNQKAPEREFFNYTDTGYGYADLKVAADGNGTGQYNRDRPIRYIGRYVYTYPSFEYAVTTVEGSNIPQTTTCSELTVASSTSNVSWSYSDPDGDLQDGYQVQVATSSDFSLASIVKNIAGASSDTSVSIDGLSSSTIYYTRVKSHNDINGWSEWSTCINQISLSCSTTPSSPNVGDDVTFSASASDVPDGSTPVYTWNDGGIENTGDTYVVNNIPSGNYQVELTSDIDGKTYGPEICTAVVSNTCSDNQVDSCTNTSFCPGENIIGTLACNGSTCNVPLGTTCGGTTTCDPAVEVCGETNVCELLPEYVSSATYNLFNKDGIFTMTNPTTGEIDKDLFDKYFRDKLQYQLDTYVDYEDVTLSDSSLGGNPTVTGATLPISGLVNADCSATLCSLNPNDYGSVDGSNTACSILKQGQSLTTTNGCYNPLGDTSTGKLLVSPNYMEPGEACSITWCAQGTDIANCALFVGGTEVGNIKGRGLSGTASFLMPTGDNAKSQTVQLICQDDANATVVQRVGSCKLDPNWTQF